MPNRTARAAWLRKPASTWRGLRAYRDDRLGFFTTLARPGSAVECPLPGCSYLLSEPEDVRHVLVGNSANYVKGRRLTGPLATFPPPHTLLTSRGADHRRRRRAIQRSFRAMPEQLLERTRIQVEDLVRCWQGRTEVDVNEEMTGLIQRTLVETVIGTESVEQRDRLIAATRLRTDGFDAHFVSVFPSPQLLPTRANSDFARATFELRSAIGALIAARRTGGSAPNDLLSLLMRTSFDGGEVMSDREVRDEAISLCVTGHDSVSQALKWVLYLVASHPDVDARLLGEARQRPNGTLPVAPYALSVIRESLRLFPPTWIFVRVACDDDRLPSGRVVPPGAKLYISPYVLHHDERWWPEPERFIPERFASRSNGGQPRHAFIPFGGGPHVCIGEAVSIPQIALVLEAVIRRYRLSLRHPVPAPEAALSLRPAGPMLMQIEDRVPG